MSEITVRFAEESDIPTIVEMAEKLYNITEYSKYFPSNHEDMVAYVESVWDKGILLVADYYGKVVGCIGAYVSPFPMNTEYMASQEVIWWIEPEGRTYGAGAALLDAYEVVGKEENIKFLGMGKLSTSPSFVDSVYASKGYKLVESIYMKEL